MDQADRTVALLTITSIILVTLNSCIIDACNCQIPLLQLYTSNTGVSFTFFPVVFISVVCFSLCLKASGHRSYRQLVFLLFSYKLPPTLFLFYVFNCFCLASLCPNTNTPFKSACVFPIGQTCFIR